VGFGRLQQYVGSKQTRCKKILSHNRLTSLSCFDSYLLHEGTAIGKGNISHFNRFMGLMAAFVVINVSLLIMAHVPPPQQSEQT